MIDIAHARTNSFSIEAARCRIIGEILHRTIYLTKKEVSSLGKENYIEEQFSGQSGNRFLKTKLKLSKIIIFDNK